MLGDQEGGGGRTETDRRREWHSTKAGPDKVHMWSRLYLASSLNLLPSFSCLLSLCSSPGRAPGSCWAQPGPPTSPLLFLPDTLPARLQAVQPEPGIVVGDVAGLFAPKPSEKSQQSMANNTLPAAAASISSKGWRLDGRQVLGRKLRPSIWGLGLSRG